MKYEKLLTGKLLCRSENYGGARSLNKVKYIAYHYDGNKKATAKGNCTYFAREKPKVSAHFFIDEKSIWLSVPPENTAWAVGTRSGYHHDYARNSNSVSIELCSRYNQMKGYYIPEETKKRGILLGKALMQDLNIPIDNVLRHYDITHKKCPEPFVRNQNEWADFKEQLAKLEEDDDMTPEQFVELFESTKVCYKTLEEIPDWGKKTIAKLTDKRFIIGDGDLGLNMDENMLRILVINDRAGIYD